MKTAVIMQPTFLPWLGWFDLLDQSDVMVILDDVLFSKRSWQQRNQIRTDLGLAFLTVPVKVKGLRQQLICEARLDETKFIDKMILTVRGNYAKAPFFAKYFESFSEVMRKSAVSGKLLDLNYGLIQWLAREFHLETQFILASELDIEGSRGEHLANLCHHLGVSEYLSPAGSENYLLEDKSAFDSLGIDVRIQVYEHPVYRQCFNPFIPYSSALDLLMNEGPESMKIICSGRRDSRALGS